MKFPFSPKEVHYFDYFQMELKLSGVYKIVKTVQNETTEIKFLNGEMECNLNKNSC